MKNLTTSLAALCFLLLISSCGNDTADLETQAAEAAQAAQVEELAEELERLKAELVETKKEADAKKKADAKKEADARRQAAKERADARKEADAKKEADAIAWKNREIPIAILPNTTPSFGRSGGSDYQAYTNFTRACKLDNLKAEIVDGHTVKVTWDHVGDPSVQKLVFATYDKNNVLLHQIAGSNNGRSSLGYMEFISGGGTTWKTTEAIAKGANAILLLIKNP